MKSLLLVIVIITLSAAVEQENSDNFQIEPKVALEFLSRFPRTIFHPGKTKCEEQKREAKEAYEERCSLLGKRFCPKLKDWKDFVDWEIGGGYESQRDPLPMKKTTSALNTIATHRTPLHSPATLRTFRTPMHGYVTRGNFVRNMPSMNDEK